MMKTATFAALAAVAVASSAAAQTEATAWTDLNLRAGPGPLYEVVAVIPAEGMVMVGGCLEAASWCQVTYDGIDGWASGDYLTAMVQTRAPIYVNREQIAVGTVTYEEASGASTLAGGTAGVIIGALIAGPVGAAVGGLIGGGAGAMAEPDPQVTSYVLGNPVETVYLDGEVVIGAGIPDGVTLVQVPDSEYTYAYVNGVPVIVEPVGRRVIYIAR